MQIAKLCAVIANMSGKMLKNPIDTRVFLPDFMKEKPAVPFVPKSKEQQRAEFAAFKQRLETVQAEAKRKPT